MASYEFTGKVEQIGKTQAFGRNGFTKREIVVAQIDSKYPNPIAFSLTKDNCEKGDGLKVGETVTVRFAVNGRRWESPKDESVRYFVDLVALDVRPAGESANGPSAAPAPAEAPADPSAYGDPSDISTLPF